MRNVVDDDNRGVVEDDLVDDTFEFLFDRDASGWVGATVQPHIGDIGVVEKFLFGIAIMVVEVHVRVFEVDVEHLVARRGDIVGDLICQKGFSDAGVAKEARHLAAVPQAVPKGGDGQGISRGGVALEYGERGVSLNALDFSVFVVFGGIVDGFESFAEIEHASADFVFACRFEVLLGCEIWHGVFFGGEDTVDGGWVSSPKRAVCVSRPEKS